MTPRDKAVATARSMNGAKWRHLGRKPWAVDCLGLVAISLESAGLSVHDHTNYGREPWNDGLQQGLKDRFGEPISLGDAQPGDVALFRWINKDPCHVGLLADYLYGGLSIVHAHSSFNVTEHRLDDKWLRLLVEVYSPWQS